MIFAKDELSGTKRILQKGVSSYNLIIASFALAIGLSLVFAGIETWPAFLVLLFGAIWNFFCDFKKWTALLFSFLVGVFYAHFAFSNGLYAHAGLYLLFYIPLQFSVCLTRFNQIDTDIAKGNYLTGSQKYYIVLIAFIVMVFALIFTAGIDSEVFFVMDTLSAMMLGISAWLRSYRHQEYFIVRYIAVGTAALLWLCVMTMYGVAPGTIIIFVLYLMYLLSDIFGYKSWKKSYEWVVPVVVTKEDIETETKKEEKRKIKKERLHEKDIVTLQKNKKRRSEQDPQIYA